MEITPSIRRAWKNYWESGFSEATLHVLMVYCGGRDNYVKALAILSGSEDYHSSTQHYQRGRTLVPLGFQLK